MTDPLPAHLAALEPGLRAKIGGWYRELAVDCRALGQEDLALAAEAKASALEDGDRPRRQHREGGQLQMGVEDR